MALRPLRGRSRELELLQGMVTQAAGGDPQLLIVSGPRRVGKTFLLQHLLSGLSAPLTPMYFEATQAGQANQLARFAGTLRETVGPDVLPPGMAFTSWDTALEACVFAARSRPLVVVIDEVTYLMASSPGFASIVQRIWDGLAGRSDGPRLVLVLAGSAVGLIEDSVAYRGALYQRPTLHLRLAPFTAREASQFAGDVDSVSLFEAYSACGGYPLHLDAWDFGEPTDDNLLRLAGTPGGVLLEDAGLLLASLPEGHRRALLAVGQGRTRPAEIATDVGTPRVERSLEALVRSKLLRAATPLGAPHRARQQYRVVDAYLRFYFRVLANHVQRVEAGQGREVLQHAAGEWAGQLGFVFEQAAREHAVTLVQHGALPAGTLVDEWWSTRGEPAQVDVLGLRDHRTVLVGEARWQSKPLGRPDLDRLAHVLRRVPDPVIEPALALWGRGGVRPDIIVGKVRGYGPADMLQL